MKKVKRVTKPKPTVYAHGAVKAVELFEDPKHWPHEGVIFGSTTSTYDEYPVHFYTLENIKKLHAWLGRAIAYLEARKR